MPKCCFDFKERWHLWINLVESETLFCQFEQASFWHSKAKANIFHEWGSRDEQAFHNFILNSACKPEVSRSFHPKRLQSWTCSCCCGTDGVEQKNEGGAEDKKRLKEVKRERKKGEGTSSYDFLSTASYCAKRFANFISILTTDLRGSYW